MNGGFAHSFWAFAFLDEATVILYGEICSWGRRKLQIGFGVWQFGRIMDANESSERSRALSDTPCAPKQYASASPSGIRSPLAVCQIHVAQFRRNIDDFAFLGCIGVGTMRPWHVLKATLI